MEHFDFNKYNPGEQYSPREPFKQSVVTGIDTINGRPIYDVSYDPMPDKYPGVPKHVFSLVQNDLNNIRGNGEKLILKTGDILELAINTDKKVRYQICDAKNGHYFIAKVDDSPDAIEGELYLSDQRKLSENPALIVCSQSELINWFSKN